MKIRKITLLIAAFFLVFGKILVAQNTLVESELFSFSNMSITKKLYGGQDGSVWVVSQPISDQAEIVLIDKEGKIKAKFSFTAAKILKNYVGMAFYERNGELHILSKFIDAKIGQQILCDFRVGVNGALENKREIYSSAVGEKGALDGGVRIVHSPDKSKMLISFLSKMLVFDSDLSLLHETQASDNTNRALNYSQTCLANNGSIGWLTSSTIGGPIGSNGVEILIHFKKVDTDKVIILPITSPGSDLINPNKGCYLAFNYNNELISVCIGAPNPRQSVKGQSVGLAVINPINGEVLRKQYQTNERVNYESPGSISENAHPLVVLPNGDILLIFGYTDYSLGTGWINLMRFDTGLEFSYERLFDPMNFKGAGDGVCCFLNNDGIRFFRTIPEEVKGSYLNNESLKDPKMKFKIQPNYAVVRSDFDSIKGSWIRTDSGLHTQSPALFAYWWYPGLFINYRYYSLAISGDKFTLVSWTD